MLSGKRHLTIENLRTDSVGLDFQSGGIRLLKKIGFPGLFLFLVAAAPAQVASPTGQSNSRPQNPAASPSVRAPKLDTTPAVTPHTPPPEPAVPVQTEVGTIEGASFRIDVPQSWNRNLVVYFHGYEAKPLVYQQARPPGRVLQQILNRGYAVAQAGYSEGGWAVPQAARETESLRVYFSKKYGAPKETYVMGHSMGGLLTLMTLELHPDVYQGGLSLCGVLAPADLVMQRAFANRVAFDAFFPGVLPDVEHIPETFAMNDLSTINAVQKALDASPTEAAVIRDLADIHTNRGLAEVLAFNTFEIKDLQEKSHGNPFDNRNLVYTGTTSDEALNEKVKRYAADPNSFRFVSAYYSPSGQLRRKLLAVHTIYDPLVPASTAAWYDEVTRRLGDGDLFVQQYVNRDGHCNITADQTGQAFDELLSWVHDNKRPSPGPLPGGIQQPVVQKTPPPKNVGKPE
jgi:pimeloyl-ACP methyl ester carboxylesterase